MYNLFLDDSRVPEDVFNYTGNPIFLKEDWLIVRNYDENIQEVARKVRSRFYELYPEVDETIWVKQGIAGYGIGPKKMSQHFG